MSELNTGTKPRQKPCKRHRAHPEFISDCVGCDIGEYNNDLNMLKGDLAESEKQNKALREEVADRADCEVSLTKMFIEADDERKKLIDELEDARERLGNYDKALNRIANAKECTVCKCQQVSGKTYQGEGFRQLQMVAKVAINATK